jgi:hypothetical protein
MKYVTAQESQNKLPLLQKSATLNNIAFQTAGAEIYRFIIYLALFIIQQQVTFG